MRFEESTVPLSAEGHADGLTVTGFRSPAPSLLSSLPFFLLFPWQERRLLFKLPNLLTFPLFP